MKSSSSVDSNSWWSALRDSALELLRDPNQLHAAAVHLPLALALLGVPCAAWLVLRPSRAALAVTLSVYTSAAVLAFVARTLGRAALAGLGGATVAGREVIARHAALGDLVGWWALACGLLSAAHGAGVVAKRRGYARRWSARALLVVALTNSAYTSFVGHLGGTAVHVHGVGLRLSSSASERDDTAASSAPSGQPDRRDPRVVHFAERVRPLLERSCMGCHGPPPFDQGGLDLTTPAGLLRGGARGPAVTPGWPDESLLIQSVEHRHGKLAMPLGAARLGVEAREALRAWVRDGAVWGL